MKKLSRNSILGLCLFGILPVSYGQKKYFERYTSLGTNIGASVYYGDLALPRYLLSSGSNSLRWHIGLEVTRHYSPRLSASMAFYWIRLGADDFNANDVASFVRNLHFRNNIKEFSLRGSYHLVKDGPSFNRRGKMIPYISSGIAFFMHNPEAKTPQSLGGNWVKLSPLNTEGQGLSGKDKPYKLSGFSIPVGIGLRYRYQQRWDIGVEASYRFTFTDYLDDVKGDFVNPLFLTNDLAKAVSNRALESEAARVGKSRQQKLDALLSGYPDAFTAISNISGTGVRRGTDKGNDTFWTFSLKLTYHIPDRIKCP